MQQKVQMSSADKCKEMGDVFCSNEDLPHFKAMIQAQDTMAQLQRSGDCQFAMNFSDSGGKSCETLSLNPAKMLYFVCGKTQAAGNQLYCGDWVSNPDGQCAPNSHETCSLSSGPVAILESECAGNAFLKKFAKGTGDKPHCGPLLRGGCCAGSLFYAMTDSDESSMWPLCVRTWATQTCGVDLTPCGNDEVESTFTVEITLTLSTPDRRLGESANSTCSNHEARVLSGKMGDALAKVSTKAKATGAKPVVISDSSCLDASAKDRTIVTSFVLQGSGADARSKDVKAALATSEFQTQLTAQGVKAKNIAVTGGSSSTSGTTSSGSEPHSTTSSAKAVFGSAAFALTASVVVL
jgi:hypothetical protein